MERLELRFLGEVSVRFDGVPWTFKGPRRGVALMILLAVNANAPLSRASLAAMLWPDDEESDARGKLRRELYAVQHALPQLDGVEWIVTSGRGLAWNPQAPLQIDIDTFARAVADAANRAAAIELYRGDLPDDSCVELIAERERLRGLFLDACREEALAARQRLDFANAIRYVDRMLATDEWREDALRLGMALRYESGDRTSALALFERFATRLSDEMGVDPMPETLALRDAVLMNARIPGLDARAPAEKAARTTALMPFVGRDGEFDRLNDAWREAANGRGSTIFIAGDAGIGKSRLISELSARAAERGGRVLLGETSNPEAFPYEPLVDALRRNLAIVLESPVDAPWLSALAEILPELQSAFPDLAPPAPLDPEKARARLIEAIARTIERLARVRPVALILEDVHWGHEGTLDVITAIAKRIGAVPALLAVTFRTGEAEVGAGVQALRKRLQTEGRATTVELNPLGAGDVARMVRSSGPSVSPDLEAAVFSLSEGNPLFVTQLIRSYAETGEVPSQAVAPAGIGATIQARAAALDAQVQVLAQTASAIGRSFTSDALVGVLGWKEGEVLDALGVLIDRGLIRAAGRSAFSYAFAHALIVNAVYDQIPERERALRHRRIAEVLGGARHWELAGERMRAAEAHLAAAEAALAAYARDEAAERARRALELAREEGAPELEFSALLLLSRAQARHGDRVRWAADLDDLENAAARLGDEQRFLALEQRESYSAQISDREGQRRAIAGMRTIAERTESPRQLAATACAAGVCAVLSTQLDEAVPHLRDAVRLARESDESIASTALDYLVRALVRLGRAKETEREIAALRKDVRANPTLSRRRLLATVEMTFAVEREDVVLAHTAGTALLEIGTDSGDVDLQAKAHATLGIAAIGQMDAEAVARHFSAAAELCEHLGAATGVALSLQNHGVFESRIGRSDKAIDLYERAKRATETIAGTVVGTYAQINLAGELAIVGDLQRADTEGTEALEAALQTGDKRLQASAEATLGDVRCRLGKMAEGLALLERAVAHRRELGAPGALIDDLSTYTLALLEAGRSEDALALLPEMRKYYDASLSQARVGSYLCWALVRLYEARGELDEASAIARAGAELVEAEAAKLADPGIAASLRARPFNRALLDWGAPKKQRA